MKTTTHFRQVLTLLLTLAVMVVGQSEAWASNWTVTASTSGMTTTFTIKRNNPTTAETVYYRTVNSSAVANVHYTPVSGTLTFNENDSVLTVDVNEITPSSVAPAFRYQVFRTLRYYDFQVLNMGGRLLCSCNSRRGYSAYSFSTENDFLTKLYGKYDYAAAEGSGTVTDAGYAQAYYALPIDDYFSNVPRDLLTAFNAQLDLYVKFEACEISDGWQYIQILVDNTTDCDTGAGDGNPGTVSKSFYMAGFEHQHGKKNENFFQYYFPVQNVADNTGKDNAWSFYGNTVGNLHKQKFRSGCRSDDGYLLLPINLQTLGIRFNASGSDNDDWTFQNLVAYFTAYDRTAPTLHTTSSLRYSVSPGPYIKGSPFYVSVAFNEPVTYDSSLTLQTSWGTATCSSNTKGTNVLTFSGYINADVGAPLEVTGYTGTIQDINFNDFIHNFTGTISTRFSNARVTACPHSWSEPAYTWTDDNSQVTAYRKCQYNCGAEERETVATTSVTTAATCLSAGSTTYTATFTNPAFETQTKDVEIPALGHIPGTPGYTWFLLENQWQCQGKRLCTRCGVLADVDDGIITSEVTREPTCGDWGETTWTATFTKEGYTTQTHTHENIPPTYQHTWGEPTYNWREEDDWNHIAYCTASRECSVCHDTESEEGSVTWLYEHNRNDRTCTEGSGNGYEATFTNDVFTTQTWCTDLGPLGHDWNIPDANWDYMPCSRHITCKRCDFERTVYATMTYDVVTEPTCTTAGEYFYHATFDFPTDNLPYPDANVESRYYQIPALGHEYDTDPVWAWAADYASATATFTCSRCHETQDYDATVTQEGNTYTATVTVNGTAYTDKQYPPVLYVGSNTVHLPGHYASVYYTFTAPADGWYHIWSEGSTEYLNARKSIGEGSWTTQDIDHIDNDFTTLIEMRAETTITFKFYTMNAVDVSVFVQPVTTHTLTVVQPADGEIWVADYNSGTTITDTGDVREGVWVELWTNVSSAMNTVTWTVTDADGQPVKVYNTSSNFFFIMPGKDVTVTAIIEPLFLDDTATDNDDILYNVLGQNGNVCIGRTLYKDGSWNTLCLPFNLDLEGSPLEGAVAKTLDVQNTTMTGTHVHLVFSEPVTTLMAGTPYIIKWDSGDDIVNPVFKDVLISTSSAITLSSSDRCTRFTGSFNARNITPNNTNLYYMTADNTLKHTTKNRTLKGFRAYFLFYPNDSDVKALTFDIDFGDGETTGIETSTKYEVQSTMEGEVYDLSGRRVSTPTKGLYIVNGKKVFVK